MKLKGAHSGITVAVAFALAAAAIPSSAAETKAAKDQIARGKYLLIVGSCNDCHTAGFAPADAPAHALVQSQPVDGGGLASVLS
jgi:mono/diheme cytochrome c family protein